MAGKRRAQPARHGGLPSWVWVVAAVGAVLLLAWFTVPMLVSGDPGTPSNRPTSVSPSTTGSTPPPSPSPAPAVTPSPSAPPPTTPHDLPALSPDQPRRLVIDGVLDVGFDNAVGTSGDTLRPASDSEVSRWADRGSPGSPGEDAVIVIGTADPTDSSAAFARLAAVEPGTAVRLRTDQGTLTYTVSKRLDVKASSLLQHPELTSEQPGRLVLVGEEYAPSGDRLTTDLVVVAILTGASPA